LREGCREHDGQDGPVHREEGGHAQSEPGDLCKYPQDHGRIGSGPGIPESGEQPEGKLLHHYPLRSPGFTARRDQTAKTRVACTCDNSMYMLQSHVHVTKIALLTPETF